MTQGHSAWLQATIAAYEAKLLRYAADIVGPSLARDVVQDTFLKLCREPRERVESHVSAWLFTVCRNGALEVKRKVRRLSSLDGLPDRGNDVQTHEVTPGAALEQNELMARVQGCLATLPEKQRELLRLKFDGELSYKEIAAITGLSISNVGFILHTTLARVREALAAEEQLAAVGSVRRER